ncbi:MAG: glycoside hydrolase family 99-like domain-containing protein [Phenylobacterium sp.]
MAKALAPAALIERRSAAQAERVRLAAERWTRFQAANFRRYAGRLARRIPPAFARQLARAKTPGRILLLSGSGLWEPRLEESLGSLPGLTVTLTDYVRAGPDAAAQPRALFDQSWYLERAPALIGSRWPPLAHYLVVGDGHNLSPHPLIDLPAYRSRHGAGMAARRLTALEHFLFQGAAVGANPHPLFDVRHYVGQSEEVAASGENPLIHYLRTGWREGLEPHPLFAGGWYIEQYPEAQAAGVAPLLHYVTTGAAKGFGPHPLLDSAFLRQARVARGAADVLSDLLTRGRELTGSTPHFDPAYYLEQEGGSPEARANPLLHYLTTGAHRGLWPSPDFDEAGYFAAHPEAAISPLSGLEHWARYRTARPAAGAPAGRVVSAEALFADLRRAVDPDPEAYDNAAYAALRPARRHKGPPETVRVIAIRRASAPDWRAVAHALPNFRGHLQPRLPADGFTDPADPTSLRRDMALAERYRLGGFCHEVVNAAAVKAVCGPKAPAFPFCLAWTGPSDAAKALAALGPALLQAMQIDGRPVVLAGADVDPKAWRAAAGPTGLFLIQRGGPAKPGFDARLGDAAAPRAAEGPRGPVINPDFRGLVHDARALIAERISAAPDAIPLVVCAHDTTPISQDAPTVWQGASPGGFQAWLEAACDQVQDRPADRRMVFVHAWNDWATGAVLAPDLRFGHGWLEAVANAADADLLAAP